MAPTFTNAQIINQIDSGYHWTDASNAIASVITYGATTSSSWVPTVYGEYGGWSALNSVQVTAANLAFEFWDELIAVDLEAAGNPNTADLRISNTSTDIGYAHAYLPGDVNDNSADWQKMAGSIWLNPAYSGLTDPQPGEYEFMTYLHEIGHALGLDHPGAYNGNSVTYNNDAEYAQDTHMYTVMSYFDAENTGADWYASNGQWYYAQTPMLHDILTIQSIYGADSTTRSGDTVYGFNATASEWIYDFSQNLAPVLTIWDGAGDDTLDLSGWSLSSTISLVPGTFSHANAMINNIAIAFDAWIENAIGGTGDDTLVGNDIANTLQGGAGNDTLDGASGNDWIDGGAGIDIIYGGAGDDMLVYDSEDDLTSLDGGSGFDTLVFTDVWMAFDLAGHGLEQSLVIRTDDAGELWSQINDYYDIFGRLTERETQFDDGTSEIRQWDVDDTESWFEKISTYDAFGNLTNETFVADPVTGNQAPTDLNMSGTAVDENAADGLVVGTLSAIDPDSGETFTYALLDDANGRFAIQGDRIVVADGSLLDYETDTSHSVIVQVTDSANNTYDETFTIDVLDIDDTGGGTGGMTLTGTNGDNILTGTDGDDMLFGLGGRDKLEGGAGNDTLAGGAAKDALIGGTGNDTFVFENGAGTDIIRDFEDGTDLISFAAIDAIGGLSDLTISNNGTTRVIVNYTDDQGADQRIKVKSATGATLDETDFTFVTGGPLTGNQAPTDLNMSGTAVDENAADGLVVGTLSAIDPDSGETFTYALLDDANGRFAIQGDRIVVADGSLLDYETDTSHSVIVQVTDSANNTYDETFTIDVLDIDDTGGGTGGMTLTGTNGDNILTGTDGDDMLFGLGGRDKLEGGAGNDTLAGGAAKDALIGGTGNDTFVFENGAGTDIIRDFEDGTDLISFAAIDAIGGLSDLTISNNGTTRVIVNYTDDQGADQRIKVKSATGATLDETDFTFVDSPVSNIAQPDPFDIDFIA